MCFYTKTLFGVAKLLSYDVFIKVTLQTVEERNTLLIYYNLTSISAQIVF